MRYQFAAVLMVTLFGCSQTSFASPIGLWKASDSAIIQIQPCGRNLCGFVVSTIPWSRNPQTGKEDYSDKYNVDGDKRSRSRVGIEVLISMKPTSRSVWSGELYSDRNGHTYSGDLIETGPTEIRIEGCWLLFCGGETLSRMHY